MRTVLPALQLGLDSSKDDLRIDPNFRGREEQGLGSRFSVSRRWQDGIEFGAFEGRESTNHSDS